MKKFKQPNRLAPESPKPTYTSVLSNWTGHVAPSETFGVDLVQTPRLGKVETLGTGLQTPSRLVSNVLFAPTTQVCNVRHEYW